MIFQITIASANRHASASACFGHNATALLPHCANTSARRLTAPALTNIGERGLTGRHHTVRAVAGGTVGAAEVFFAFNKFVNIKKIYYLCRVKTTGA